MFIANFDKEAEDDPFKKLLCQDGGLVVATRKHRFENYSIVKKSFSPFKSF